jgi:hypothetical protein
MPKNKARKSHNKKKPRASNSRPSISVSTTGHKYPLERFTQHKNQNDYIRRIEYESTILSSTLDRFYSNYFILGSSGAANLTSYQTLFDQYKVTEVCIEWIPSAPYPVSSSGTANPMMSTISTVLDFDDEIIPTSVELVKSYPTYKTSTTNRSMGRRYKTTERLLLTNDGTTASTSTAIVPTGKLGGGFIDIANVSQKFLGTKWYIQGISGVTTPNPILGRFVYSAIVVFRQGR